MFSLGQERYMGRCYEVPRVWQGLATDQFGDPSTLKFLNNNRFAVLYIDDSINSASVDVDCGSDTTITYLKNYKNYKNYKSEKTQKEYKNTKTQKKYKIMKNKKHKNYKIKPNYIPFKRLNKEIETQSGFISTASDFLTDLQRLKDICGDYINANRIEDFILYIVAISDAESWKGIVASTLQYYKTFNNKSIIDKAIRMISNISTDYEHELNLQDGSETEPKWLQLLKQGKSGWTTFVHNPAFKHVSKLLSISSALGLCDLSRFNLDFNGMRVFTMETYHKHVKASDLVDAIINTVTFFIEGGYWLFKTGNIDHFMYGDKQISDLETEYFEIKGLINHVKTGNLEKYSGISENDFAFRLENIIKKLTYFNRNVPASMEKRLVQSYIIDLKRIEAQFQAERTTGKLRAAPFAVYVCGTSGVGKSHVAKLVMMQILKAGGYDNSDERIVVLNADDKYMSNYRSHVNGVYIDDLGNTIAEYCQASPTQKIIDIVNNVPSYAVMPEVELKGKVSIEPKAVVVTSNKHLAKHARIFSNEPFSIVRRCPIHILVRVKPEFATSDGRLNSHLMAEDDFCPNVWDLRIGFPDQSRGDLVRWQEDPVDLQQALRIVTEKTVEHERSQQRFLRNCSGLNEKVKYCEKCKQPMYFCYCACETHNGDEDDLFDPVNLAGYPYAEWEDDDSNYIDIVDTENTLPQRVKNYLRLTFPKLKVPVLDWFDLKTFEILRKSPLYGALDLYTISMRYLVILRDDFFRKIAYTKEQFHRAYFLLTGFQFFMKLAYPTLPLNFLCIMLPFIIAHKAVTGLRDHLVTYTKFKKVKGQLTACMKKVRELDRNTVLGSVLVVLTLHTVIKFLRTCYNSRCKKTKAKKQGNIIPKTASDIAERDAEANVWLKSHVVDMPSTDASKSSTPEAVCNVVERNIAYMRILDETDQVRFSNILFLKSNVAIIPNHMWMERENMKIQVVRDDLEKISSSFTTIISRSHSYHIPETDLSVVYIASGGSWRDLTKFLPVAHLRRCPATMVYRQRDGSAIKMRAMIEPRLRLGVENMIYSGFDYKLDVATFKGLCLGTWVTTTPSPIIAGFHLAGRTGSSYGVAGTVTKQQIDEALEIISRVPGVLLSKDSGTLPTKQYGVSFYEGKDIHPKSPVNFLEAPAQVDMYGSVKGRSTYYSEVVKTDISDTVAEITGVENKWGKPQFRPTWKPFQVNIATISNPALPFEGGVLSESVSCYLSGIRQHVHEHPFNVIDMKPLTNMQNICGIDGKRFIDALVPSTSLGFPLTGPKSSQLVSLDPDEHPDFTCPKELNEMFWKQVDDMEEIYCQGERCYPIFKGCLKDEPTKLTKDKVRVFQAAPIALQLLIRKYFLPIVRYLQLNPTVSELAVGINAHGPEWDQLARHIMKNGRDRILAGDYSKYDTRMPAQVTLAAFYILIEIAKMSSHYTQRDIEVMKGIATDCCYPTVAMNGDLLQFYGSNPSGNNITVIINCIVNSLNLRCAFYTLRPFDSTIKFRDAVSLITYGDDFKSSVVAECSWYNHISVANFLKKYDQRLTMPDKESDPTEYMTDSEVDFLKRRNVYNPELDKYLAVLDEDSIFKSLHCILKSKALSNIEVSACNIDGALREWFFYGPEVYEMRREQMNQIAKRHDMSHMCRELCVPYEERFQAYCEQYNLEPRRQVGLSTM
jgi:hypothetical protein